MYLLLRMRCGIPYRHQEGGKQGGCSIAFSPICRPRSMILMMSVVDWMSRLVELALFASIFFAHHDPSKQALDLIERLRSPKVEERSDAVLKLQEMGQAAEPVLRKAARDADPEVAARVQRILFRIDLSAKIPSSFKASIPNVVDRLSSENPHEWTSVWLEASSLDAAKFSPDSSDAEFMAVPALRGAQSEEEKQLLCSTFSQRNCRTIIPVLFDLLADPAEGASPRKW
jgi:hypothetical protein